ncbi:bifunctional DNA-binding transcriptional regulator/O6-methylguanine-DNA methyltransferase Ada [Schlegelella sp. S2-27]|uniref:Bifunctional DNA-binding transcriptional regulator/O6-methylguanine-DNA methyltransferase Ada n=2 Tax=Caldimonas mangrovi TaxID=2944811 RepID=A0ABT0YVQ6_9BURK|nr:bifunctional DNA-binding transcriptional regulator/O6-methylguanine-DNA methyltransferase Ada [Caldimonas mangrovi]MCM5682837.1 bifunctional DNA-binding transcriptional regulator/O6-methylguanine-DNA methyltransferase Ada [Caldimonas mangrovi]
MQTQTMVMPAKRPPPLADDTRWTAVLARDAGADGRFFYSVRTTGVYCRPSCGARLPLRENVAFHATAAEAEAAGFRPCRRCKPDEPSRAERQAQMVAHACRAIEAADEAPDLATLAADAGVSPYHFHRVFKAVTGVTPKAYADAQRAQRVRQALPQAESVTAALYDAGFNSNARFYARTPQVLGMTPSAYRAGGVDATIRFAIAQCSLGAILVAATEQGVCAITLGDDPEALLHDLQQRFSRAQLVGAEPGFERLVAQVVGMVESPDTGQALPLDIRGTAFQQRVWQALRDIPAGSTASYAQIAERLGAPKAVRAVAAACAANPLAVAIPCHRVVRSDGGLSGYRWGVERKRVLLQREAAQEESS